MKSEEVFSSSDKSENLALGALMAALPFLFFLPYVMKDKRYSPYCMFRANQSLVTFVIMALLGLASKIIGLVGFIPVIGGIITGIAGVVLGITAGFYYIENLIFAILGSGKRVLIFGEIEILK
ncbi:MAG: hypothetical protein J5997_05495 [Oscillospiraceae bacterium]|nr:hypothetical protein [Oscillospiraceae bacterium]